MHLKDEIQTYKSIVCFVCYIVATDTLNKKCFDHDKNDKNRTLYFRKILT